MIEDNGDPYNPCSSAYIGKQPEDDSQLSDCVPPWRNEPIIDVIEYVLPPATTVEALMIEREGLHAVLRQIAEEADPDLCYNWTEMKERLLLCRRIARNALDEE